MGNSAGKLNTCFCPIGAFGEISGRHDIAVVLSSNPLDEGIGHSFCYIRPPENFSPDDLFPPLLPTISGASVSANTSTPLSTTLFDPFFPASAALDHAASFESSPSFASVPLQPIPRSLISSGPLLRNPGSGSILGSAPIERGFLSGPIERGFMSGPIDRSLFSGSLENRGACKKTEQQHTLPLETSVHSSVKSRYKIIKWSSIRSLKDVILGAIWAPTTSSLAKKTITDQNESVGKSTTTTTSSSCCSCSTGANLSSQGSVCDENDNGDENFSTEPQNLQWAHGKAGEDRVHVVVSEEHGWVFVGIYDGFNGPDATDFLLSNLYTAVHKELKGLLWSDQHEPDGIGRIHQGSAASTSPRCSEPHSGVLGALSEALRKTEEAYLEIADRMILENPVLSLMGSCVLVMLMVGEDVYLMNVGDSRAVLGQKTEDRSTEFDPFDDLPDMDAIQLTVDHNTLDKEEAQRIKGEHPGDHGVITNERVKGSLKVTRAFGAGFLKNPKWNKGLLEMLRVDYLGSSPYITCSPSLHHRRIGPNDKFLILSSDGLYQYFTNEEAVIEVELFMASTPEGDPAQHLIEEVLFRAAKKAGIEFHELLDIAQGERRRYHDDVFIIIVSFEGRTWQSSL